MWSSLISTIRVFKFVSVFVIINPQRNKYIKDTNSSTELGCCCTSNIVTSTKRIIAINDMNCIDCDDNTICFDCYDNRNKDDSIVLIDINRIDCNSNEIGSVDTIIVPITCNGSSPSSSRLLPSSLSINTSKEIGGDRIDCNNTGGTSIGKGGVYGSKHLSLSPLSLPLFGYCFTFRINNNASSSASSFIHHVSCNPHTDDVLLGSVPKSLVLQSQDL